MAAANPLYDLDPTPGAAARRVCVVNDDAAVRVSLKFVFQAAGFVVSAYASGRGLLASSALRVADGFVLDHKPRGADGLELARRLRGLGLGAPIVLITGFRSGPLETFASAVERVIPAARVDEEIIAQLIRMIEEPRDLRNNT
jgi:two-component system, LuxR family, response regulator FixJ